MRPFVACLCPTAWRPWLASNAIACFLSQRYPLARRKLWVLDDSGVLSPQSDEYFEVVTAPQRFGSLPEKFNFLLNLAGGADIISVWEDDDVYLPWHLDSSVAAIAGEAKEWSKPSRVITLCSGSPVEEDGVGRFHASICAKRSAIEAAGGWPKTKKAAFDLQFISRMCRTPAADPCKVGRPSYIFRWSSTGSPHGECFGAGYDDEQWSDKWWQAAESTYRQRAVREGWSTPWPPLTPWMDEETIRLFETLEQ
jgi:hypothetical protein